MMSSQSLPRALHSTVSRAMLLACMAALPRCATQAACRARQSHLDVALHDRVEPEQAAMHGCQAATDAAPRVYGHRRHALRKAARRQRLTQLRGLRCGRQSSASSLVMPCRHSRTRPNAAAYHYVLQEQTSCVIALNSPACWSSTLYPRQCNQNSHMSSGAVNFFRPCSPSAVLSSALEATHRIHRCAARRALAVRCGSAPNESTLSDI
jgi:hypothetical protein